MAKSSTNAEYLQRLRDADTPEAKAAVAVGLLEPRYGREVLRAALQALVKHPEPQARPTLWRLYSHLAEQGVRRDPGTYLRSEIVRALRTVALPEDLNLVNHAASTYEYPPPAFKEEAGLLRAGALVVLAALDETAARFAATRLLADPHSDPMSGEPALTAVEVLASLGEVLPLYFYATQGQDRMLPEVGGECLRQLGGLPEEVLPSLVAHYADCAQPVLLVGLCDLLIHYPDSMAALEFLAQKLSQPPDLDVYRYLVAALLASGHPALRNLLAESARHAQVAAQVEILLDVLGDVSADPAWAAVVAVLEKRRPRRR